MKTFAALAIACVAISVVQAEVNFTEDQKTRLQGHHKACGGQESYLGSLLGGVLPDEKPFKDYLLCVSKRIGIQNEAGEVQKDVLISILKNSVTDPNKAEEYINKCLVQGDPADVVFEIVGCLEKTTPKFLVS